MNAFENLKPFSKIVYLFVFCLAGLFLAGSIITIANGIWNEQIMQLPWGLRLGSGVQMVLMFFMPAVTLVKWSGNKPIAYLALDYTKNSSSYGLYILAFLILLTAMPFITLLSQINQTFVLPDWLSEVEVWMRNLEESAKNTTNLLLKGTSVWDYLGNILFIGVFAAIAEEVFFRGVLQKLLIKLFKNIHAGVWIGAFIFSLMHMQFYGFIPRIVLGAMLGYLFVFSGSLWLPIFVHFMNNALVVTFNFFFSENSFYQYLEEPPITFNFLLVGFMSVGFFMYLFWLFKSKATNNTAY